MFIHKDFFRSTLRFLRHPSENCQIQNYFNFLLAYFKIYFTCACEVFLAILLGFIEIREKLVKFRII